MAADADPPSEGLAAAYSDATFLLALLEAVPAFVGCVDETFRIRFMNRYVPGLTREQVLGTSTFDWVEPAHHALHRRSLEGAMSTGEPHGHVVKGEGQGGRNVYYQSLVGPFQHPKMGPLACILATDVTEHVARAEALRESEEKLRVAVSASGVGLWSWDLVTDRVEWNERMHEILGTAEVVRPEAYLNQLVHPEDRPAVQASIDARDASHRDDGALPVVAHRIIRPDGGIRWLLPTGRVTRGDDGKIVRMRGGTVDITDQRHVEERLREAQKMEAIGGLTAGVAHNFNNMLAIILPALEVAKRLATPREQALMHGAIHAAQRASELVTQLMRFAPSSQDHRRTTIDLVGVAERAVGMCWRTFDRRIELMLTGVPTAPVTGNASELEQVLINLLINARDAVEAAPTTRPAIRVEAAILDGDPAQACVRVIDNGVGMSPDIQRRIFEPFFTTKEPGRGTGLGLSVSYAIVREHGGRLEFQSTPGQGATCSLILPLAGGPAEASPTEPVAPPPVRAERAGKILLVDDSEVLCVTMALLLGERGHQVTTHLDVTDALAALDAGLEVELVLLDRSMPGWTPTRAVTELRKRLPTTPILFFTGLEPPEEEKRQVQGVVLKPVAIEPLLAAIEPWLPR